MPWTTIRAMKVGVTVPMTAGDVAHGMPFPDWPTIRDYAARAEALGLDSIWVFDHLLFRRGGPTEGVHEAWTILAALAASTTRAELGALVLCAAFRNPALLAKMAVAADEVSGGRLILGLGTGWHAPEFEAFGYRFDHRVGQFEEALRIVVPLLAGETVTATGNWHSVRDAVLAPPPRRRIPVLVAARGPRMMALAASFADAWNLAWHHHPDERFATRMAEMDAALRAAGRASRTLTRSSGIIVRDPDERSAADAPAAAFGGSVEELATVLDEHAAAGIDHAIVWLEPKTPRNLERLAAAVAIHRARAAGDATIPAP
jgi:alkanesulfonate monooxygenase SsuD/methylene tetrahydromethanopterin reductase-like flavin-dependent oxidoreductase (luciferase family)